jgi:excisionase family DNA binding protein
MTKSKFEPHMRPPIRPLDGPSSAPNGAEVLDELLTVDDVASLLKVNKSWVYEHTRERGMPRAERLPHIKLGKYVRFDARAVRAFLEKKSRTT